MDRTLQADRASERRVHDGRSGTTRLQEGDPHQSTEWRGGVPPTRHQSAPRGGLQQPHEHLVPDDRSRRPAAGSLRRRKGALRSSNACGTHRAAEGHLEGPLRSVRRRPIRALPDDHQRRDSDGVLSAAGGSTGKGAPIHSSRIGPACELDATARPRALSPDRAEAGRVGVRGDKGAVRRGEAEASEHRSVPEGPHTQKGVPTPEPDALPCVRSHEEQARAEIPRQAGRGEELGAHAVPRDRGGHRVEDQLGGLRSQLLRQEHDSLREGRVLCARPVLLVRSDLLAREARRSQIGVRRESARGRAHSGQEGHA